MSRNAGVDEHSRQESQRSEHAPGESITPTGHSTIFENFLQPTSKLKDLREPGPIAVAYEGLTRSDIALLDAPMAQVDRPRRGLAVANGRERKAQREIGPQLRLGLFDDHDILASLVDNRLRNVALGQERVQRGNTTFQDQVLSEGLDSRTLIGFVVDGVLGERDTHMVRQRR